MHINRTELEAAASASATARKRRVKPSDSVSGETPADAYAGSIEASSLAELAARVTTEPMYREALVKDLERRVSEGRYYVPSEQIVSRLLRRLVLEANVA